MFIQSVLKATVSSHPLTGGGRAFSGSCAVTHEQSSGVSAGAAPGPAARVDPGPGRAR